MARFTVQTLGQCFQDTYLFSLLSIHLGIETLKDISVDNYIKYAAIEKPMMIIKR